MRVLANFLAFQAGWFACLLGAANGNYWLGPMAITGVFVLNLYLTGEYIRETVIGLIFIAVGFAVDTQLTFFGVYTPQENILPSPFSPPWLMAMWLNLATIFNVSLRWMHGKYRLAALLGGLGGPLSYYGGGSLGALAYNDPLAFNLLVSAAVWTAITPLLLFTVTRINMRF